MKLKYDLNNDKDMRHIKVIYNWILKIIDNATITNITLHDVQIMLSMNGNATSEEEHCETCSGILQDWSQKYDRNVHVYLALVVCVFGTVANILNIAVLTRKDMACAPINRILTGLAVADMLIMMEYIPFSYYYYTEQREKNFAYWGAVYMIFHLHFTQILHTISICLTLTLAIWRFLAIGYPDQNHTLCSETRCTLGISLSYLLPLLLCIPTYFISKIGTTVIKEDGEDVVLYHVMLSETASKNNLYLINFWIYAVIIKLLPCFILTIISSWLIRTLVVAKKRKQVLRGYNACPLADGNQNIKKSKAERRADRTTKMLVAVLLLFLITEFPQGIFALIIGMKGKCMYIKCYQHFGSVMDILALLNGSINFILYCWMNRMFRLTFGQLFKSNILAKWAPPNQSEVYTTCNETDSTKL